MWCMYECGCMCVCEGMRVCKYVCMYVGECGWIWCVCVSVWVGMWVCMGVCVWG